MCVQPPLCSDQLINPLFQPCNLLCDMKPICLQAAWASFSLNTSSQNVFHPKFCIPLILHTSSLPSLPLKRSSPTLFSLHCWPVKTSVKLTQNYRLCLHCESNMHGLPRLQFVCFYRYCYIKQTPGGIHNIMLVFYILANSLTGGGLCGLGDMHVSCVPFTDVQRSMRVNNALRAIISSIITINA